MMIDKVSRLIMLATLALFSSASSMAVDLSSTHSNSPQEDKFSIDATGIRESTDGIQRLIDLHETVNIPKGNYLIDAGKGLRLRNGSKLIMDAGTTLIARPERSENYALIKIYGIKDVVVTGGKIIGERFRHMGKSGEWGMGIDVKGSDSIRIADVTISDCWGDGVYIGGLKGVPSTNVTLDNMSSLRNRRQGLSITSGNGILVTNSRFMGTYGTAPSAGIDLEPNKGESVSNVTIRNCVASNNAGPGIMTWNSASGVKIMGCTIQQNASSGIYLGGVVDAVHVSGNVISGNKKKAIVVDATVTNYKLERNTYTPDVE